MPRNKPCHEDYIHRVCLLCFQKSKRMRDLSAALRQLIEDHLVNGLDANDERLPKVVCNTCYNVLMDYKIGIFTRKIDIFDYSKLSDNLRPVTRSSPTCECLVCQIGQCKHNHFDTLGLVPRKVVGRPALNPISPNVPSTITICSLCLCIKAKGISHNCTPQSKYINLIPMISDKRCGEQIASHILKEKSKKEGTSKIDLSQHRGRPVRLELFPDENNITQITHEQMEEIKTDLNLSQNKTLRLARNMRICSKNRSVIESGLTGYLKDCIHKTDNIYTIESLQLGEKKNTVVFCSDICKLVEDMTCARGILEGTDLLFKIGLDYGGGFLKVCLNMICLNMSPPARKRVRFDDGVDHTYKNTSVNKLIILAAAQDAKETYETIKAMCDRLNFETLKPHGEISIAADLKMANMMFGLMAHSSTHPCTWCTSHRYDFLIMNLKNTFFKHYIYYKYN